MSSDMQNNLQRVLGGRRITIPEDSGEKLGINVGDYVLVETTDRGITIRPVDIVPRTVKDK